VIVLLCKFESAHALETLSVSPHQEITRNIGLTSEDKVTGTLTATGLGTPIDFTVTDPNGNLILQYDSTLGTTFSFIATNNGTYTMHFRNSYEAPAQCTIDYSITNAQGSSMVNVELIATIIATIMASVVAITGVINLIFKKREMRVHFKLMSGFDHTEKPIVGDCQVVVLHPDKVIEKCKVYYNNVPLPWREIRGQLLHEKYFGVSEGGTFFIPKSIENENAEVIVMDGKKRLNRPIKFKQLSENM
jgi:hypothetical protein